MNALKISVIVVLSLIEMVMSGCGSVRTGASSGVRSDRPQTVQRRNTGMDGSPSAQPGSKDRDPDAGRGSETGYGRGKPGAGNETTAKQITPTYDPSFNRGVFQSNKKNQDKAIESFSRAIMADPGRAEAYNERGFAYANKKQYEKALADYDKAIRLNPRLSSAYYNRGNVYYQKGTYDRAIADYTRAIELNPRSSRAYNSRGASYLQLGRITDAERDITKAYELDPEDGGIMVRMAEVQAAKQDAVESCRWLRRGVEKGYDNWEYIKANRAFDSIRTFPCYDEVLSLR